MKIWADVSNAAGNIQGDGPITAIESASISRVLDGPGELSLAVPLGDERSLALLQNERRVALYQSLPGTPFTEEIDLAPSLPIDVTASSVSGSLFAYRAFDKVPSTAWSSAASFNGGVGEAWIQATLAAPVTVSRMTIYFGGTSLYTPKDFVLEALIDGAWSEAVSVVNEPPWSNGETRSWNTTRLLTSTVWRLRITAIHSTSVNGIVTIHEIGLFGMVSDIIPSPPRSLGRGIVRQRHGAEAAGQRALTCSGPDQLEELRRANTLLGRVYNGDTLPDIIDDLVSLAPGWTAVTTGVADHTVYARFDGASVLKALQELAARYGYHFRLSGDRQVTFGPLGDAAPLRILQAGHALTEDLETNDDVALIETLQWVDDSEAVANWIIPVGGGEGEAALTLEQSIKPFDIVSSFEYAGDVDVPLGDQTKDLTRIGQYWYGTATIHRVVMMMRKVGNPTGQLQFTLETVGGGGAPSGTLVHANASVFIQESSLPTEFQRVYVDFPGPVPVAPGAFLVVKTSHTPAASDYVEVRGMSQARMPPFVPYYEPWLYIYGSGWAQDIAYVSSFFYFVLSRPAGDTRPLIEHMAGPDGSQVYYLRDTASITAHGEIQRVFTSDITPVGSGMIDRRNAADALYDAAVAWLERYAVTQTVYNATLAKVYQDLQPGQLVRLTYKGYVTDQDGNPVSWRDVNDDFWVVRVTETHDAHGPATQVELSSVDRAREDMSALIVGVMEAVSLKNVVVQPYPAVFTYVYRDTIQTLASFYRVGQDFNYEKRARFSLNIPESVLDITRVTISFKTFPLFLQFLPDMSPNPAHMFNTQIQVPSGADHYHPVRSMDVAPYITGFMGVYEDTDYPAALSLHINGQDVTALYGPSGAVWNPDPLNAQIESDDMDITDFIVGPDGIYQRRHTIEFSSSSTASDVVSPPTYPTMTTKRSHGWVEITIHVHCTTQAIKL